MTQLVKYDAMCRAIDAAYRVDEVKVIRNQAVALETYARQAKNTEAERQACEIRLRAERKAGDLSRKLEKQPGARTDKAKPLPIVGKGSKAQQLRSAGITKKQSEQWEKLAAVPNATFEHQLSDRTQMPTTNGIIRAAAEPKKPQMSPEALSLWGSLRDFERDFLDKNPRDLLETLTPKMLDEVHTRAPRVAAWLKRIGAH